MSKKRVKAEDQHFLAFTAVSDMKNSTGPERDLAAELFNKGGGQNAVIDAFERAQGFAPSSGPKITVKHHVKIMHPSTEKDCKELAEIMNSDKYKITYYKDNWTGMGEYCVFLVYAEIIKEEKPTNS